MNTFTDELAASRAATWTGDATASCESSTLLEHNRPPRPAWIEIDVARWRQNFRLIRQDMPAGLQLLSVVKDEAYGHGLLPAARVATECGVKVFAVSSVDEAMKLRETGIRARILLLGDRQEAELPWCVAHELTCCVSEPDVVRKLAQLAASADQRVPVHLKVNTGMNRYGVRWNQICSLAEAVLGEKSLLLEGALSHFAQSDETDKTFARLQLARFYEALDVLATRGIHVSVRHLCNSGGFLDLPEAHFDMVRMGILPLGVFPSSVCRRIPGMEAVMSVKARIVGSSRVDLQACKLEYSIVSPK